MSLPDSKKVYQTIRPSPVQSWELVLTKVDDWIEKAKDRSETYLFQKQAEVESDGIQLSMRERIVKALNLGEDEDEVRAAKIRLWDSTVKAFATKRESANKAVEVASKEVAETTMRALRITSIWYQSVEMALAKAMDTSITMDNAQALVRCAKVCVVLGSISKGLSELPESTMNMYGLSALVVNAGNHVDYHSYIGFELSGRTPMINVESIRSHLYDAIQVLKEMAHLPLFTVGQSGTQTEEKTN
jgi:hypothetical protein